MKYLLFVYLTLVFVACKAKQDEVVEDLVIPSEVALTDVSFGNCLNLEKLARVLQDAKFSVPAAIMTTDLKPISEMSSAKLKYFSYATFNYKVSTINELGLFTQVRQKDCKSVQMLSSSEEVLTFEVTAASDREIAIKLKDKFRDTMTAAQKKVLFERQQPFEIAFKYVDPHRIVITEKYSTVDPICTSKNTLTFVIRKDIHWASHLGDLPRSYDIDTQYLNQVKDSVAAEALVQVAAFETPQNFSIDSIRAVMRSPIKEELKLCGQ